MQRLSTYRQNLLLTTLVFFGWLCILQPLKVRAQENVLESLITVELAEVTVAEALSTIGDQAGVAISYSSTQLDTRRRVTVTATDKPLKDVLSDILGQDMGKLLVSGRQITIQTSAGKGIVTGTVRTSDGQPAGFAAVSIRDQGSTQADGKGRFRFDSIEAGTQTITSSYLGLASPDEQVNVPAGGTVKVAVTLSGDAQTLQEVVVTGQKRKTSSITKLDVPLENLPMMVQMVDQTLIQQRQITSIKEAISSISGVTYSSSFAGGYDTFTGRGFALTTMRNGITVANSVGPLYADNIEQIDVLKGPASIQYGDISPGSVMNLVTKKPLDYDYKRFELKLGQYSLFRPTIDVSGPLNKSKTLLFRLNSSLEKSKSFRDEIENENFLFAPTITWKITPRLIWNVEGVYNKGARTMDPGIISPDNTFDGLSKLRFESFLGEPANVYRSTDANLFSTLEYRINDHWRIRNVSYYTNATRQYGWMSFDLSSLTEAGDIDRTYSAENGEYGGWGTTFDLFGTVRTGMLKHNLLVGGEYLYDDRDRSLSGWGTLETPINIYHPEYGQSPLIIDNMGTPGDPSSNRERLGVYIQDQIGLLNERLQLLVGLRFNHITRASTWSTGIVPDEYKPDEQNLFNPRIGLLGKPTSWLSVFASYTNSFEMNGQNRFTGEVLDPADAHQYEAGLKGSFLEDRLGVTLAAFRIDKKNVSGYVSGLAAAPDFDYTYYAEESGTASYIGANHRSQGLELDLNGHVIPQLFVNLAASYIDATIVDDPAFPAGNQLGGSPKWIANLWANYTFDSTVLKGMEIGAGYSFRGENYATGYNRPEALAPDYSTVDAALGYSIGNFFTRLNVRNITNEKGYTYGMYGGYYPLWSRRAVLSIGVKL